MLFEPRLDLLENLLVRYEAARLFIGEPFFDRLQIKKILDGISEIRSVWQVLQSVPNAIRRHHHGALPLRQPTLHAPARFFPRNLSTFIGRSDALFDLVQDVESIDCVLDSRLLG